MGALLARPGEDMSKPGTVAERSGQQSLVLSGQRVYLPSMDMPLAMVERRVKGHGSTLRRPEDTTSEHDALHKSAPGGGSAELRLDGVSKRFGSFPAVRPTSLNITAAEVTGLIGPNGAGKTTLFGLMDGHYLSDGGSIFLQGRDVTKSNVRRRAQAGISRTFQTARVFPRLTVAENMLLAARQAQKDLHWWQPKERALRHNSHWISELAGQVGLEGSLSFPASALTQPERKRLDLAMAIGCEPTILLLDEPTAGVSREDANAIQSLLVSLRKERPNVAIIVSSHDIDLVLELATRLVVLVNGSVLADGAPESVVSDKEIQSVYLGTVPS
jgi:branched-chain amino acid transport system ATP-binding protein